MNIRKKTLSALMLIISLSPAYAFAALPRAVATIPVAVCVSGKPQITITWSGGNGSTSYSVFRNTSSTYSWNTVSSKQTTSVYIDKNIASGKTYKYQVKSFFSSGVTYSNIVSIKAPTCTVSAPVSNPTPAPTPTPAPQPAPTPVNGSEKSFSAYFTGYGWPDNTPASANISHGVIHSKAGGSGTYADPITLAVGHSIINGNDILDYPKGTKFYVPAYKKYLIVEDTCGDGNTPQNGPCHSGKDGKPWLDVWVGGEGANVSSVYSCEEKVTGVFTVIQDPTPNYTVNVGPIFNGTCISLSSDIAIKI